MERERSRSLELARHYLDIGRPDQALEALRRGDIDPEDPALFQVQAHALYDSRRFSAAANAARQGLGRLPESVDLLETLALSELELGHGDEAERAIAQALEVSPGNAVLHAQRALILARRDRFDQARAAIEEALRLAPDMPHVLQVRAQVEFLAKSDAAEAAIEDLLRVDPENRVGHVVRANLAARDKRVVAAAKHFGEAARLNPHDHGITEAARESRVLAHPLLAPLRPIWRLQRNRSLWIPIRILIVILALTIPGLVFIWLLLVLLSFAGPPLVRALHRRRYGR